MTVSQNKNSGKSVKGTEDTAEIVQARDAQDFISRWVCYIYMSPKCFLDLGRLVSPAQIL